MFHSDGGNWSVSSVGFFKIPYLASLFRSVCWCFVFPPLQALPRWAGRERWPCSCLSPSSYCRIPLPVCSPSSPPRQHRVPHSSPYTPEERHTWSSTNSTCISPLSSSSPFLPSCTFSLPVWGPCLCTLPPPFKVWTLPVWHRSWTYLLGHCVVPYE